MYTVGEYLNVVGDGDLLFAADRACCAIYSSILLSVSSILFLTSLFHPEHITYFNMCLVCVSVFDEV